MYRTITLRGKCSYLDFFWSVFSSNRTEYGPEILRIRTLFTQCKYTISAGTCNCWAFVLFERSMDVLPFGSLFQFSSYIISMSERRRLIFKTLGKFITLWNIYWNICNDKETFVMNWGIQSWEKFDNALSKSLCFGGFATRITVVVWNSTFTIESYVRHG